MVSWSLHLVGWYVCSASSTGQKVGFIPQPHSRVDDVIHTLPYSDLLVDTRELMRCD